jgi:uncharacterized membrane protein YgcG
VECLQVSDINLVSQGTRDRAAAFVRKRNWNRRRPSFNSATSFDSTGSAERGSPRTSLDVPLLQRAPPSNVDPASAAIAANAARRSKLQERVEKAASKQRKNSLPEVKDEGESDSIDGEGSGGGSESGGGSGSVGGGGSEAAAASTADRALDQTLAQLSRRLARF